ncbi:MAG TPA: LysR family transcriptional regulator substrate-binding protein [Candidatus Choladousia intestinavium]|uniref:LysR family transcriptional regulator substrate-binding protein n=1 Tax=Candidatus Choladousia intestinavium TaxID=2840727 RepID=A0A9D1AAB8_9FIRM|nr:LysR family transcriptional regulator substrate-binding protein [Candidatus Choladousia intestinavium]
MNREKSVLKIHAIPVMSQYRVTELLAGFKQEYPGIGVQLAEVEKISLRGSLEEGLCDVIYTRNFQEEREEGYEKVILEYDRFAAVLPEGHPLYGRDRIALEELKGGAFFASGRTDRTSAEGAADVPERGI